MRVIDQMGIPIYGSLFMVIVAVILLLVAIVKEITKKQGATTYFKLSLFWGIGGLIILAISWLFIQNFS